MFKRIPLLFAGLLLLTLTTLFVGSKLRGNGPAAVLPMPPTPTSETAADGRVSGYEDDPVIVYCKHADNKIDIYRLANGVTTFLQTFTLADLAASPQKRLSVRLDNGDLLGLTEQQDGLYYLSFRQQGTSQQVGYFGKYFNC